MTKYIVRRLIGAIPVMIGVSIVVFVFIRLLPGDPATAILGQHATAQRIADMREALGLDKPLWEQYLIYLQALLSGDLGRSLINGQPVLDEFLRRMPAT